MYLERQASTHVESAERELHLIPFTATIVPTGFTKDALASVAN